jgi:hypothetical protein
MDWTTCKQSGLIGPWAMVLVHKTETHMDNDPLDSNGQALYWRKQALEARQAVREIVDGWDNWADKGLIENAIETAKSFTWFEG